MVVLPKPIVRGGTSWRRGCKISGGGLLQVLLQTPLLVVREQGSVQVFVAIGKLEILRSELLFPVRGLNFIYEALRIHHVLVLRLVYRTGLGRKQQQRLVIQISSMWRGVLGSLDELALFFEVYCPGPRRSRSRFLCQARTLINFHHLVLVPLRFLWEIR